MEIEDISSVEFWGRFHTKDGLISKIEHLCNGPEKPLKRLHRACTMRIGKVEVGETVGAPPIASRRYVMIDQVRHGNRIVCDYVEVE